MTQYEQRVKNQAVKLAAEEWANQVSGLHAHSLTSMWYDNDQTVKDVVKGVVDVQYMDGRIERTLKNGKKYTIVEGRTGADLVQEVVRNLADSGKELA